MTDLTELGAIEVSEQLSAGSFSCHELMTACLDRIDAINPGLNAIVALRPRDELLHEASVADQTHARGWLHGIPVAIKDLADTQGLVTTYGSPLFASHKPAADSSAVKRLRSAGAIIIGKTNTPEFGLGSHTYNPVYGITRNPYDTRLSAGGSSGGAAAALAARLMPIADGSDMMGSLRNPAAFNNVYGFRPSAGRIPSDKPADACMLPLATTGPMGRSITDIARLLDTLIYRDISQPWSLPVHESFADSLANVEKHVRKGTRIGWIGDADGYYPMADEMLSVCQTALADFESSGAHVEAVSLGFDLHALFDAWSILRSYVVAGKLRDLIEDPTRRALLKPEAVWEIERGLSFTAMQIHEACAVRTAWFERASALFDDYDALCLPSAAVFPFDAEQHWLKSVQGVPMKSYHEWMSVVVPASLAGLPALAVPAGFNRQGLPAGLQLIGRYGDDMRILQLGQTYHLATDWPGKRPPAL